MHQKFFKAILIFIVLSFFTVSFAENSHTRLMLDNPNANKQMPRNFRTTSTPLSNNNSIFSIVGLHNLHALSSGQFSQDTLKKIGMLLGV